MRGDKELKGQILQDVFLKFWIRETKGVWESYGREIGVNKEKVGDIRFIHYIDGWNKMFTIYFVSLLSAVVCDIIYVGFFFSRIW